MTGTPRAALSLLSALVAGPALAQTANFDARAEGVLGTVYIENGITFRDLDQRFPGSPPPGTLTCEDARTDLAPFAGFSPPNAMGFGGWSDGGGVGFSRIHAVNILPPQDSSAASLSLFIFEFSPNVQVSLIATEEGVEVARVSATLPLFAVSEVPLAISGVTFDALRIECDSPDDDVFFAVLDNVVITPGGSECDPDVNEDGNADQADIDYLVNVIGGGANPTDIDPDFNHDGNADQTDVASLIDVIAGGDCP